MDGIALKSADGSLEENARDARYKALAEIALDPSTSPRSAQDDKKISIVIAHHAGDQAETMYMRLRRGTTLAGLRGIQETRILFDPSASLRYAQDDTSSIHIIRPFLNVTRAELLAYARENKLKWCEDESNSDVKFTRNKVRHDLLPKLEKENPGATEQLCRIAGLADKAYKKVMDACEEMFGTAILDDGSLRLRSGQAPSAMTIQSISIEKKQLRKVLLAHENADLSEMFRLWLSEKGLRFPIGFFYDAKEPAHVKIPHHAVYRRRAIVKIGHTVQICEFSTPEEALNFVSCEKKDKGL